MGLKNWCVVGGQNTLPQSLKSVQVGGHIHILGMVAGTTGGVTYGELSLSMIVGRLNVSLSHA